MIQFDIDDRFTYSKDGKTFITESSLLDLPAQYWNSLRRVPVETKIILSNPKTGRSSIFEFTHADMSPENEVGGWNYKDKNGIQLLIIND